MKYKIGNKYQIGRINKAKSLVLKKEINDKWKSLINKMTVILLKNLMLINLVL